MAELTDVWYGPLADGGDGSVWVATTGGLVHLDDGSTVYNQSNSGLLHDHVQAIAVGPDGAIWAGGAPFNAGIEDGGLSRFDGTNWTNVTVLDDGLPSPFVTSIDIAEDGSLWVGTPYGVAQRRRR